MDRLPRDAEAYRQWWTENTDVPYGLCWCGCNRSTTVAETTTTKRILHKGEPRRFIHGHRDSLKDLTKNAPRNVQEYRNQWLEKQPDIPYGYCWCGCGLQTPLAPHTNRPFPWFRGEPMRYIHGHNTGNNPYSLIQYIEQDCGYDTPCWVWQRFRRPDGYGRTSVNGKLTGVHRAFYEQAYGPIPKGKELDHLCRVPACCRPSHLEPVTGKENKRRRPSTKLSPKKAQQIRELATTQLTRLEIAHMFGVHQTTVGSVIRGETWT